MDEDAPRARLIRRLDLAQRVLTVVLLLLCVLVALFIARTPLLVRLLSRE